MDKPLKKQKQTAPNPPGIAAPKIPAPAPTPPTRVPPLFRKFDWVALLFTFAAVWIVYFVTLAPELTLEDSGELCTGSFYAGIPHPPGYPFWAIYSWLWTKILPFGNVAWRVEIGEATAAAMACGLVALVVSRGSSMLMEGIEGLKSLTGKWEAAVCFVAGVVPGLMLGLGGVMWSESVAINRISLFGVPWVMIVLACLFRWIYAPHQRRYLYCAMFFFGICATIHQTLLIAMMGIEVAIVAGQPKLGRDMLLLWNSLGYLALSIAHINNWVPQLLESLDNPVVKFFFHLIGIASICASVFLGFKTRGILSEWLPCIIMLALYVLGVSFYFYEPIAGMTDPPMQWGYPRTVEGFFHALSRGQYEKANPTDIAHHPMHFVTQLGMLIGDIAEEFNWVLVFVALVPLLFFFKMQKRERAWITGLVSIYTCIGVFLVILMNPSPDRQSAELVKVFFISSHAVVAVMSGYGLALVAAYLATHYQRFRSSALMFGVIMLVPAFLSLYAGVSHTFYGGLGALPPAQPIFLFFCLTAALVLAAFAAQSLLEISRPGAPAPDRERWFFIGFVAAALACLSVFVKLAFLRPESLKFSQVLAALPRIFTPGQYSMPVIAGLMVFGIAVVFVGGLLVYRQRAPLAIVLVLFGLMPLSSGLSHWADSEQRNHWYGYYFGHDMFTPPYKDKSGKPIYPEMDRHTILFGGTDPGRFCPTYMIFCESFIPHRCQPTLDQSFDRRDVYLITQNALADGTYLNYLRAQYFRSQQVDPPFFSELARTMLKDKDYETNILARLLKPLDTYFMARGARIEKRWRTYTSWFKEPDFLDLQSLSSKLRPSDAQDPVSRWVFERLSPKTQELVKGSGNENQLRSALSSDLNVILDRELKDRAFLAEKQNEKDEVDQRLLDSPDSKRLMDRRDALTREIAAIKVEPLYDSNRFSHLIISDYLQKFIAQNPRSDTRIRLNRLLLEAAYPKEIAKSLGGVYPDREIYIPSNDDSQRSFQEYIEDASSRLNHDQQLPNEPRQLKPGESVSMEGGKVQVSGQVAVMSINGLLAKVIFDKNPDNEVYVEESMPLDWMYPHLTPFGVIMKVNRPILPELSDDVVRRDHEFWSQYSERLTGTWLTYETPVKDIVAWIEKVYLRHDLSGFTGDRRFIRDNQAQKAFSKLRSSIAGVYAWRLGLSSSSPTPRQYLPKTDTERRRMVREADFAFRQAFVYCPYSPEAVFRYVQFLMGLNRIDDALLVAQTCLKLDPENGNVVNLINQLTEIKNSPNIFTQLQGQIEQLEADLRTNPDDFEKAFDLSSKYLQVQQIERATMILDRVLENPKANIGVVLSVAQAYAAMNNGPRLEAALDKLTKLAPNQPEAWYDLAAIRASLHKNDAAIDALKHAVELNSQRLAKDPKAHDLRNEINSDPRLAPIRNTPAFKTLMAPTQ